MYYICMQCEADAVAFTEEAQRGLSSMEILRFGWRRLAGRLASDSRRQLCARTTLGCSGSVKAVAGELPCQVGTGPLHAQQRTRIVHHLKQQPASKE